MIYVFGGTLNLAQLDSILLDFTSYFCTQHIQSFQFPQIAGPKICGPGCCNTPIATP